MDRKTCLLLTATFLVGCQPQVPLENPFMPQTTVPPPGTAGTTGAPIYGAPQVQVAPSVTIPATPGVPATIAPAPTNVSPGILPPTTPAPQSTPYYPPGGTFDFRQGSIGRASDSALAADGPTPETSPIDAPGANAEIIGEAHDDPELFAQLTHPQNALAAERLGARYPTDVYAEPEHVDSANEARQSEVTVAAVAPRVERDARPIRIVEREPVTVRSEEWSPSRFETQHNLAGSTSRAAPQVQTVAHASTAAAGSGVALASYSQPIHATTSGTPRHDRGKYGFEEDYSRLTGRLEYSQATGQWKLRYVPIDGATDGYGGSVVISNPTLLEGRCPGDFVTIEGEIISDRAASSRYAPKYEARQVADQP